MNKYFIYIKIYIIINHGGSMTTYINSIYSAIYLFPLIALIITFPFMIINYHRYGSISKIRTLIIYSFILYLICAYFLVILPLPSREYVSKLTIPHAQLKPFNFIFDFIKDNNYSFNSFKSFIRILKQPSIYQPIFNIILTIPFGMYLRYYFRYSLKKTVLYSFLLSCFFEITQLTGLYYIYPRNYRMFDVDDIMFNTLGGLVGYYLIKPFLNILPSKNKIDNNSYIMSNKVTGIRRIVGFIIDLFFKNLILGLILVITLLFNYEYNLKSFIILYLIINYISFVLIPIIFKGKTIGKNIVNLKLSSEINKTLPIIIRTNIMFIYFFLVPSISILLIGNQNLLGILIILVYLIYILATFFVLITNNLLWYEKLTKTRNINTINNGNEI